MTIQFKTDAVYTLGSLKLLCTSIEDNTIWLKSEGVGNNSNPTSDDHVMEMADKFNKVAQKLCR